MANALMACFLICRSNFNTKSVLRNEIGLPFWFLLIIHGDLIFPSMKGSLFVVLYSNHDTGILVMRQQWILSASRLGILNVCPSPHKVAMRRHAGKFAGDGAVHSFGDVEVCREENVKVTLVNL
jgi:hypothetical protein